MQPNTQSAGSTLENLAPAIVFDDERKVVGSAPYEVTWQEFRLRGFPAHFDPSAPQDFRVEAFEGLEHRAQNLEQIFAARMLYFKVLDRPYVLHK